MSTNHTVSKKITSLLAVLFFIPTLYFFGTWANLGWKNPDMPLDEKVGSYLGYYPHFLQNIGRIHYITIFCCIAAMYFSAYAYKQHLLSIRIVMMLIVLFSFFILVFTIFQMV